MNSTPKALAKQIIALISAVVFWCIGLFLVVQATSLSNFAHAAKSPSDANGIVAPFAFAALILGYLSIGLAITATVIYIKTRHRDRGVTAPKGAAPLPSVVSQDNPQQSPPPEVTAPVDQSKPQ